jgi:hypothetical protein
LLREFHIVLALVVLAACGSDAPAPNPDAEVIEQLRQAGSDLRKPHPIEFFFYFPTESAANRACGDLRFQDFSVTVRQGASTSDFLCLATKSLIPTVEELNRLSAEFEGFAVKLGGEYDGWGSPVID